MPSVNTAKPLQDMDDVLHFLSLPGKQRGEEFRDEISISQQASSCFRVNHFIFLSIFCSRVLSPDQASLPHSISGPLLSYAVSPTAQSSLWFTVSTADDQRSFLNVEKIDPYVLLSFE